MRSNNQSVLSLGITYGALALGALVGLSAPATTIAQCSPSLTNKVIPSDGELSDLFGTEVSVSGEFAFVGAFGEDEAADRAGAVYVYQWDGSNWTEIQKLLASDADFHDQFGFSVDVDGDVAIICAHANTDFGDNSGSAYIFRWDGSSWNEEQKLLASDGKEDELFGYDVAIDGDVAVVGTPGDPPFTEITGYVYVFRWDGSSWVEEQKIAAAGGSADESFGSSVDIDNNVLIAAARFDGDNGVDAGSAYVYRYDGSSWLFEQKFVPAAVAEGDQFGYEVAVDANTAVVSTPFDDDFGPASGSAYVFEYNGLTWDAPQKIIPADGAAKDQFGSSVSISGDTIAIGSAQDDSRKINAGSVYVYRYDDTTWVQEVELLAADASSTDQLGWSVSVDGDNVVGGANGHGVAGAAYIFDLGCSDASLELTAAGDCPGSVRFEVSGATPGNGVAFIYAFGLGDIIIPSGNPCVGTSLQLNASATLAAVRPANGSGIARLDANVPSNACGRVHMQALELNVCLTSNTVAVN